MKRIRLLNVILALCLLTCGCQATPTPTAAPATEAPATEAPATESYAPNEVILLFLYNYQGYSFSRDNAVAVLEDEGLQILDEFEMLGPFPDEAGETVADAAAAFLTWTDENVETVVDRINGNYPETVVNAGPKFYIDIMQNDPQFAINKTQWGLDNTGQKLFDPKTGALIQACTFNVDIDAPAMWIIRTSNAGAPLAIIDTGGPHNDLSGGPAFPFLGDHGTAVAGVAGARTNNKLDVAGVVWDAVHMDFVHGSTIWGLSKSIFLATAGGAKVINISAGTDPGQIIAWQEHLALFMALLFADLWDVLVVAAAGNDNVDIDRPGKQVYPASYNAGFAVLGLRPLQNLLVVTATDCEGRAPSAIGWPNRGPGTVDLEAPGEEIMVLDLGGTTRFDSGTSFAAPHATGVAALIRAANPALRDDQVKQLILNTVVRMGRVPLETGSDGMLNGFRALFNAAGPLALWKFAVLGRGFLNQLLAAPVVPAGNLNKIIDNLIMILTATPLGPNFTRELQQKAIEELESLRGRQKVNEQDLENTRKALDALDADVEQIPPIIIDQQVIGTISVPGEVDTYSFEGTEGEVIVIDVDAQAKGYDWDPVLRLYDVDGTLLSINDDTDGHDPWLSVSLPSTGRYYFSIAEYDRDKGGSSYMYDVTLSLGN